MGKITFIGAGGVIFTRTLVNDILTFPELRDWEICLMDISTERLKNVKELMGRVKIQEKLPTRFTATNDLKKARK